MELQFNLDKPRIIMAASDARNKLGATEFLSYSRREWQCHRRDMCRLQGNRVQSERPLRPLWSGPEAHISFSGDINIACSSENWKTLGRTCADFARISRYTVVSISYTVAYNSSAGCIRKMGHFSTEDVSVPCQHERQIGPSESYADLSGVYWFGSPRGLSLSASLQVSLSGQGNHQPSSLISRLPLIQNVLNGLKSFASFNYKPCLAFWAPFFELMTHDNINIVICSLGINHQ